MLMKMIRKVIKKRENVAVAEKAAMVSKITKVKSKFEKHGQKYTTPSKSEGLFVFYTSLLNQRPDSKMALKWCVEHGVFSDTKHTSCQLSLALSEKATIK
jgi:hypothetical protein